VSVDVAAIVERARVAAQQPAPGAAAPAAEREQLKRIAAEFESMLLVQVLKDMRRAGSWEEEGGDTLGAQSLFETLDVELASHLARVKGLGLGKQLEEAFERVHGTGSTINAQFPTPRMDSASLEVGSWELGVPGVAPVQRPAPDVVSLVKAAVEKTVDAVGKTASVVEKAGPAVLGHMVKPVAGAVTSAFGWRRHPITHEVKFHQGVDLRAAYGQEVQSAAAGKVVFSGDQGSYGSTVVVEHQDGTRTRYAHLSARLVKTGDQVAGGEPLGRAGRSGSATGTHLHFEVIAPNGQRVQPEQWAGGRHAPVAQAHAGHDHGSRTAGNPPVVTVARSIKDRPAGAD
jgi:murein DD-endopeptidase MepM/ murein hydrolase activator NlpD